MALVLGWEAVNIPECNPFVEKHYQCAMLKELENILDTRNIRMVFQPIVSLTDASIIGYEALSRGPHGSILERPNDLFASAEKYNMLWELEFLCRAKALEKAKEMSPGKMLFINVDPNVINDYRFKKGLTREMLAKYSIDATNIIFEITERNSIDDYKSFRKALDNYISQGYKIAIDDTGAGYSGLKLLAETRPQYVKIDMDLIRDIDKDSLKQSLMKAFCDFSIASNIKVIAEGIETIDELNTLISIGVHYGQGYFLQKPVPEFLEISPKIKEYILAKSRQKKEETFHTLLTLPIGEIAMQDISFSPDMPCCQAIDYFNANHNRMGIVIVEDGKPQGVLMKDKFLTHLATQYGVALYINRPIKLLMDPNPLIVDFYTPLEQVSKVAICRSEDRLYDYIIVVENDKYFGITTVKHLLEKTTQLELNRAKHANPLSGLPGNIIIEEKIKQVIENQDDFSVLYFDLDNFKAYNDVYGFDNGDKILCLTAQIIQQQINKLSLTDAFTGHIGGDDFITVLQKTDVEQLCQAIIDNFDARVKDFYIEEDRQKQYIIAKNRHGVEEKFPITSLSIAVVTNKNFTFYTPAQLAEVASRLKKKCKLIWKSCYHIE